MRQRMKKIAVCFMAALAVLVSVLSVPVVAYADEGEWVPFVQCGDFLNPSTFAKFSGDDADYVSVLDREATFNVSPSNRYRMKIVQYEGTSDEFNTGWFELSASVENMDGLDMYQFVFDTSSVGGSGNLYLMVLPAYGQTMAGIINDSVIPLGGEPFSLYVESFVSSSSSQQSGPAWSNGQFVNQSMVNVFDKPAYRYGERAVVPTLNQSSSGKYVITYNGVDYLVSPRSETDAEGHYTTGFYTDDGTLVGAMVDSSNATSGIIESMFLMDLGYVEGATLTMMTYVEPSANLPTFFGEATSALNWLVSTFGVFLAFMLKNPICFIGLIVSLVVLAVKLIQSTTGNK